MEGRKESIFSHARCRYTSSTCACNYVQCSYGASASGKASNICSWHSAARGEGSNPVCHEGSERAQIQPLLSGRSKTCRSHRVHKCTTQAQYEIKTLLSRSWNSDSWKQSSVESWRISFQNPHKIFRKSSHSFECFYFWHKAKQDNS